jgi:hypothetical protein
MSIAPRSSAPWVNAMRVPKIPNRTREIPVGRTAFERMIEALERLENPKVGASPWWLVVALLLALSVTGTFLVLAGAVLSPMAFDAPDAAAKTWPWVLLFSALGLAAICPVTLAAGLALAWRRRLVTSCGILSFPALVAVLCGCGYVADPGAFARNKIWVIRPFADPTGQLTSNNYAMPHIHHACPS